MQQIADWLNKFGMSEYAERFAENDIDMAVLPDLTDQHLKGLGVSLGRRLKMLRAMRDLGNPLVVAAAPSEPAATEPTRTRGPRWVRRYRSPLHRHGLLGSNAQQGPGVGLVERSILACADVGHSLCGGSGWVDLLGVAQPQPRGQFPAVGGT
jgi:hypothetical protein